MKKHSSTRPGSQVQRSRFRSRKGGAMIVVVILTAVLSILFGNVLNWGLTEKKVNERLFLHMEARNAAEAALEYGAAQLRERFQAGAIFRPSELAPSKAPLQLWPSSNYAADPVYQAFDGTHVDTAGMQLTGGEFPQEATTVFIPTELGSNEGKWVDVRNVRIWSEATARDARGHSVTAYGTMVFQIQNVPIFSHAIFYNMDLELHPGPEMTINGPVHANGNIYAVAKSPLHFTDRVTTSQDFLVGMKLNPVDWSGVSGESSQSGADVFLRSGEDGSGNITYATPYKGGTENLASSYWDSRSSIEYDADGEVSNNPFEGHAGDNWHNFSENRWNGYLQTADHGVSDLSLVGIPNYEADDPTTQTTGDDLNYAYSIIEPNLPLSSPHHKGIGEREKFAYKAGLTIRVHQSSARPNDADGNPIEHAVKLKDSEGNEVEDYWISLNKVRREDPPANNPNNLVPASMEPATISQERPLTDENGNTLYDENGNVMTETVYEVQEDPIVLDDETLAELLVMHPYDEDDETNKPVSGFFDERRGEGLDVVEFNMSVFNALIDDNHDDYTEDDDEDKKWKQGFSPQMDYNGVVYVEFPTDQNVTPSADGVIQSVDEMGLLVTNADSIPNPSYIYDQGGDFVKKGRKGQWGLSLATNNAMYVKGHFNADGNKTSDGPYAPDDAANPNPPAAVVADAVTILSDNWDFTKSKDSSNSRQATYTEFNAALMSGLTPTLKGDDPNMKSGGSHNFPRFLEKWSGVTLTYRGSLVALFESEVADEPWHTGYYSPPKRQWGYYNLFRREQPPGGPSAPKYVKTDFNFLGFSDTTNPLGETVEGYATQLNNLPSDWNSIKP